MNSNCLGDEDIDKQDTPFVNDEVYSADHAVDRKDTEEERHQTTSIDDFRIMKVKRKKLIFSYKVLVIRRRIIW